MNHNPESSLRRLDAIRRFLAAFGAGSLACLLGLTGCATPGRTPVPAPAAPSFAFVGVDVVTLAEDGQVLRDQTVIVEGDRIAAVGPRATTKVPGAATRIEGRGRYLIPGLADMHVHLEYFEDPAILQLFVANGVTSVRNMDGRPYILDWKRRIAAGELLGPTLYTAGPLLDGDPPALPDNTVVRTADEARAAVAAQAAAGYDFVKVYSNLSRDAYAAILESAREHRLPVAGHVPRNLKLEEVLAAGQTSIEHLADYDEWIEADDSPLRGRWNWSKLYLAMPADETKMKPAAERLAHAGVWAVPTLVQAGHALVPPESLPAALSAPEVAYVPRDSLGHWEERVRGTTRRMDAEDWAVVERGKGNRRRLVKAMHDAGVKLLIGTDTPNPFVVPGFSLHEELQEFVDAGISPAEALAAATREAARFFGELDDWGTVEVGKRADLVLLKADPLADIGHTRQISGVMVRGRWLPQAELAARLATWAEQVGKKTTGR